ncbi:N-acetyltransferase [Palleronia sediminis]|uniref:N-acetyltransferase n=1 Tax=Palleronia sediminis TaxID=2547833 RepID=A0A4R6AEC8_9RHOB|nr:GNAT family N-acetyltransferase [Palleronia sediminis]TDL79826.1 N-acetyltransferase [Palleronia sediminis]
MEDAVPPRTLTLPDGARLLIRQVVPEDAPKLIAGFDELSAQSRIMRFLRAIDRLPDDDVRRYVTPDHHDHEALAAEILPDAPGAPPRPVGIAHWFRYATAPDRAELAVTIVDSAQRRGIGRLLLARLFEIAAARGIRRIEALVHPENRQMAGLLRCFGAVARRDEGLMLYDIVLNAAGGVRERAA